MNIFLIVLFIYVLFMCVDLYPEAKNKNYAMILVYLVIAAISVSIILMLILGIKVPSPADKIKDIVFYILGTK